MILLLQYLCTVCSKVNIKIILQTFSACQKRSFDLFRLLTRSSDTISINSTLSGSVGGITLFELLYVQLSEYNFSAPFLPFLYSRQLQCCFPHSRKLILKNMRSPHWSLFSDSYTVRVNGTETQELQQSKQQIRFFLWKNGLLLKELVTSRTLVIGR